MTAYEAQYRDAYLPVEGAITSEQLKRAALRPNDQHSIEEIDPAALPASLRTSAPKLHALILAFLNGGQLEPEEASDDDGDEIAEHSAAFEPTIGDMRVTILRAIKQRRGQRKFRNILIKRYGSICMVSGCTVLDVLEAAHIAPYRGDSDHHADNGLLLRGDLHTLFDLDLLAIHPVHLTVQLSKKLSNSTYWEFHGVPLKLRSKSRPADSPLAARWEVFRLAQDGS